MVAKNLLQKVMTRKESKCEGLRTKNQRLFIKLEETTKNVVNEYLESNDFATNTGVS